jgi:hypothetical protein
MVCFGGFYGVPALFVLTATYDNRREERKVIMDRKSFFIGLALRAQGIDQKKREE